MQIALGMPSTASKAGGVPVKDFARIADQGGLHSMWLIDRIAYDTLDPLTTLATAAAVTERIRLGTAILLAPTRNPVLLAKQSASLDVLSQGRLTLGLGVGSRAEDYLATSTDFHTRGRRFEADVEAMRHIWAGESPKEGVGHVGPRPVQNPIPMLFGGTSEPAIARGARLGDGYIAVPRGVQRSGHAFDQFRSAWRNAGRSGAPELLAFAYYCVNPSVERAREHVQAYVQSYYGVDMRRASGGAGFNADEYDMVGPASALAETLSAYEACGTTILVLYPALVENAQVEEVVKLAHDRKTT